MRRYSGLAGWVAAILLVAAGAVQQSQRRTQSLVIVDTKDRPRALIATSEDGVPFLILVDSKGQPRCTLSLDKAEHPVLLESRPGREPKDLLR